jgi:hypothetical protein
MEFSDGDRRIVVRSKPNVAGQTVIGSQRSQRATMRDLVASLPICIGVITSSKTLNTCQVFPLEL